MITLPIRICHRFTLEKKKKNYMKVMWLFVGESVWTVYNPQADHFKAAGGGGGQYVEIWVQTVQWCSWGLAHPSFTFVNVLNMITAENLSFVLAFILST